MRLIAEGISRSFFRKAGEANYFEAVKKTDLTLEGGKVYAFLQVADVAVLAGIDGAPGGHIG